MVKVTVSVLHTISRSCYVEVEPDVITLFRATMRKFRRRIYVDDELLIERPCVADRLVQRVDEEIVANLGHGEHTINLETILGYGQAGMESATTEFIISNVLVNDAPVPYIQDDFNQIRFVIE
jgi:hypothetical protein